MAICPIICSFYDLARVHNKDAQYLEGGGVLPYMDYVGMRGPKDKVFQPFWS